MREARTDRTHVRATAGRRAVVAQEGRVERRRATGDHRDATLRESIAAIS
jgi:hypothetical protein